MRPNESGGQILENSLEINLTRKALRHAGLTELADELRHRIDYSGNIKGNLVQPYFTPDGKHEIIDLSADESEVIVNILERTASGDLPNSSAFEMMLAGKMIESYNSQPTLADQLKAEREAKEKRILARLFKLIFR